MQAEHSVRQTCILFIFDREYVGPRVEPTFFIFTRFSAHRKLHLQKKEEMLRAVFSLKPYIIVWYVKRCTLLYELNQYIWYHVPHFSTNFGRQSLATSNQPYNWSLPVPTFQACIKCCTVNWNAIAHTAIWIWPLIKIIFFL